MERELASTQFHPSYFQNFRYVYPVVSRRSGGVSIGINLSPTKRCNFRCVYCQVERAQGASNADSDVSANARIDLDVLRKELTELANLTSSGDLFRFERFAKAPLEKRVLQDFAFSGDGEPTLARDFGGAVDVAADVRKSLNNNELKLVLITNSTRLQEPEVVAALDRFAENNGKIWAKFDGGDDARLRTIDRTTVPFEKIVENLKFASRRWGVDVQTAALSWNGATPTSAEIDRYCAQVRALVESGGTIREIQLYTVARVPTESGAVPLSDDEMNVLAAKIREKTGLRVDVFYSK